VRYRLNKFSIDEFHRNFKRRKKKGILYVDVFDEIQVHYQELVTFISQIFPAYSPDVLWSMDAKEFFYQARAAKAINEQREKNKV